MNVPIYCVTFARDREWTEYLLGSIQWCCHGFSEVVLVVPDRDRELFLPLLSFKTADDRPVRIETFREREGLGMLHHEVMVQKADMLCPDADAILHVDGDCVFLGEVTPETYMQDGKPMLLYVPFAEIAKGLPYDAHALAWQQCTERALWEPIPNECMIRHPMMHIREVYPEVRGHIAVLHGTSFEEYVLAQKPDHPEGYAEFTTLGHWAMTRYAHRYHPINVHVNKRPNGWMYSGWTHWPAGSQQEAEMRAIMQRAARR
jgi:hypothetical protein